MFLNEQIDITSYRMKKKPHTQSTSLSYWYQKFQIIKLFKIIFLIIFMSRYHVGILMKLTLKT